MANNYTECSTHMDLRSKVEEDWMTNQLEDIYVYGNTSKSSSWEFVKEEQKTGKVYRYCGPRFAHDFLSHIESYGDDLSTGFQYVFEKKNGQRSIIIYSDESADLELIAYFAKKFYDKFRFPGENWTLQWADTCSKPRVDEFGGGCFVVESGRDVVWLGSWDTGEKYIAKRDAARVIENSDSYAKAHHDWEGTVAAHTENNGFIDWLLDHKDADPSQPIRLSTYVNQFEVQHRTLCDGWVNTWTDDDGGQTCGEPAPVVFKNRYQAQNVLSDWFSERIADTENEPFDIAEFRIWGTFKEQEVG